LTSDCPGRLAPQKTGFGGTIKEPLLACEVHFIESRKWLSNRVRPFRRNSERSSNRLYMPDLTVTLGRLRLQNPILVASGTFGYAREMAGLVDFARLGGIIPKTVTRHPRAGNPPPRTIETPSGMLNALGLDNDGIEHFIAHHLPYLRTLPTAILGNIAGKAKAEFGELADLLGRHPGLAAADLDLSSPTVSGGLCFASIPQPARLGARRR